MKKTTVLMLLIFGWKFAYGAVIRETLVPDNSSCLEPGDFECLCSHNSDCNTRKGMECIDYKCFCMYPMRRIFDNNLRQCVGLVGAQCEIDDEWTPKCIKNSECEDGRCVCRDGYSVTNKLMCKTTYGEECGPFLCNGDRGLACKSGTCQCLDSSYTYSAVSRRCFDPEAFVGNVIRSVGPGFFREFLIQKTVQTLRRLFLTLTFPFRFFKFG